MLLFPLPSAVVHKIGKTHIEFLWQDNRENMTFNLVRWSAVSIDKKSGGFGIGDLRFIKSKNVQLKWLWKLNKWEHCGEMSCQNMNFSG